MLKPSLFALLAAVLLSACVETRFESPLGDNIETHGVSLKPWSCPEKSGAGEWRHVTANDAHPHGRKVLIAIGLASSKASG